MKVKKTKISSKMINLKKNLANKSSFKNVHEILNIILVFSCTYISTYELFIKGFYSDISDFLLSYVFY